MRKGLLCLAVGVAVLLIPPSRARAQTHEGGGGGGGGGCGDVFGDLIHILRYVNPDTGEPTGQPILQQRWVEIPGDDYGWGYCPIAVDANGAELGFIPLSCDVAVEDADKVIEVDYFGRLNGGRTKERNNRMHFNEVISSIKVAEFVRPGPAGRLELGYDCDGDETGCAEWATIDSPMESMGLYTRLMKYGHFQTDPEEDDLWFHGDPSLLPQYHPALGPEDYPKFHSSLWHLLPLDPDACFSGEDSSFDTLCADPELLDSDDFTRAASFLGGAANKTGWVTVDLVQYFNRILKITMETHTAATLHTLPALVRDCWLGEEDPVPEVGPNGELQDPDYDDDCTLGPADSTHDEDLLFPDVHEDFVDFSMAAYDRANWRNASLAVVKPLNDGVWKIDPEVPLLGWLNSANPGEESGSNIDAFVKAAGDALRSIEFIHNYAIPEDLGWDFIEIKVKNKDK